MTAPAAIDPDDLDRFDVDAEPEPGSDDDEDAPVHADLGYEPPPAKEWQPAHPARGAVAVIGTQVHEAKPPACPPKVLALPSYEAARGVCRSCQAGFDVPGGVMLHQAPGRIEHTICGECSGKRNRDTVEQTREVIRDLKAATACGNAPAERDALKRLELLVGKHQAGETASAIRARLEASGGSGGKGGRR